MVQVREERVNLEGVRENALQVTEMSSLGTLLTTRPDELADHTLKRIAREGVREGGKFDNVIEQYSKPFIHRRLYLRSKAFVND